MQESIAQQIRNYFQENQWNFDEQKNAFLTGVSLEGHTDGAMIQLIVNDRSFMMLTAPDIDIPEEAFLSVQTYANEINNLINIGCIYLDKEQQVLVFRTSMICADNVPSAQQIDDIIGYSVTMVQDIAESLLNLLEGEISPEDAAVQAVQAE